MRRRARAPKRSATLRQRRAFTLIETSLAVIIIGVGVLALLEAQQTFFVKNAWSTHSSTAAFLAGEIREMSRSFSRHDSFSGGIYFENPANHTIFRGWGPEATELAAKDFDDLDDLDGVLFGLAPNAPGPISLRLPGPINAFGKLITETMWDGASAVDSNGAPVPLKGWSQYVVVEKVDPTNFTQTIPDAFYQPAAGSTPERTVDQFPVRVTVSTLYQDPLSATASEIMRTSWVVLP